MKEIITSDKKMLEVIHLAKTVSQSRATVLIQGESGTGKELIARIIHEQSARKDKNFIAINCAAIPDNLLESELFGYEKGAFTGAYQTKEGRFEAAHEGSLFLDEISEMEPKLQAKLLRVLQESQVDRIGGNKPIRVNVRIIAATNKNLSSLVKLGKFREDLFYRLNVVNINLPPLRNRLGDLKLLSENFIKKILAAKNESVCPELSEDALMALKAYHWPGNIRELENVLERALLTHTGNVLTAEDLKIDLFSSITEAVVDTKHPTLRTLNISESLSSLNWQPGTTLNDIERHVIIEALRYHAGNRTHTARALGISIRTLRNKIADYRRLGLIAASS